MKKIIIIGALGMDFHTFNRVFKDNPNYEVMCFTSAVEQNIGTTENKDIIFPPELAGKLYPNGIPIYPEIHLKELIKKYKIDEVVFAYSDVSHASVINKASIALAAGADYKLISGKNTMIKSNKLVISVCAVRTGCGKSQVSRRVYNILKEKGYKVVAIREPMPYGNFTEQNVMRFEKYEDLDKYKCTVEEREEYEPYIEQGLIIYSGIDYQKIIEQAEKEADIIIFDGGNNEISFYVPDLLFVVVDPLRPGHELEYYPGEVNVLAADVFIINKINSAEPGNVKIVEDNLKKFNSEAIVIKTNSNVTVENPEQLKGKKVIVVEDGPTLTHGKMSYGAGYIAARDNNAIIIDPKPYLVGKIKEVVSAFPQIREIVPAMGYSDQQIKDLEETLNNAECDFVINGSPINLEKIIKCNKPIIKVSYDIEEIGKPTLEEMINKLLEKVK